MPPILHDLIISKTGKNTGVVFLSTAVNVLTGGLFFAFAPRLLGPSDYGIFSTVVATGLLAVSIANLGIDTGILRFASKKEDRDEYLSIALKAYVVFGFSTSVIGVFFSKHIAFSLGQPEITPLIQIALSTTTLLLLANFFTASLQAKNEFVKASYVNIVSNFFRLMILIVGALFFTLDLYLITLLFFLIPVLSLVTGYILDPIKIQKTDSKKSWIFFKYNIPVALTLIISSIPFDNYFLLKFAGPVATGIYAAPFKILTFSYQFGGNFTRVLANKLSTLSSKKDLFKFSKTISPILLLFVLVICVLVIAAKPIIIILFGSEYTNAIKVMQVLSLGFAAFLLNTLPTSVVLYYFGKSSITLIIGIAKYIIFVALLAYFVPRYFELGAAIAFSISEVASLILMSTYIAFKLKNEA